MDNPRTALRRDAALERQRRFYQTVCGLPARIRPEFARIEFTVGSVGAVTMPAHLGAPVKVHLLKQSYGRACPIISHVRAKRWTFLVCPNIPGDDKSLYAELFRRNVSIVPPGGAVALPSPGDSLLGYREWVSEPTDGFRSAGTEVIDAIRCCLSQDRPVIR
ncbi:DNA-directed RNA polymerase subunit beta [Nocardia brasiliensis]|uniref:DNA-directed RNA polymerase subunit beta n=1 Tax=Nocardia brasiliensis TaxID=37326 RepID=UPI001895CAB4|nr:DNA-directed RNA polymerase subunit beta [Nocardia brasiliensis]MBF6125519.1 DNA-directed RNA polymerase subunit beta [Nocardia brasiliensis]